MESILVSAGKARAVEIRRAGSGGPVVYPPFDSWLEAVKRIFPKGGSYVPDAVFRILFIPSCGNPETPGYRMVIAPGDHQGKVGGLNSEIPTSFNLLCSSLGTSGMLELETTLDNLKTLHATLGAFIDDVKDRKIVQNK